MSRFFSHARTVLGEPQMLAQYARWCARPLLTPRVPLAKGAGCISGFRSFTEYWWGRAMVPDTAEMGFYRKFTASEGVILDIGANLGWHAISLAALHADREVHAFEPSPRTFEGLEQNIGRNGARHVRAHRLAVADRNDRMKFDADRRSPGTNRLLPNRAGGTLPDMVEVDVTTMDSFLAQIGNPKVAMLKIDVEGFEPAVLRGAEQAFARGDISAALIELCPGNLEGVGYSVEALFEAVRQSALGMYFLDPDGNPRQAVDETRARQVSLCNVALLKL